MKIPIATTTGFITVDPDAKLLNPPTRETEIELFDDEFVGHNVDARRHPEEQMIPTADDLKEFDKNRIASGFPKDRKI